MTHPLYEFLKRRKLQKRDRIIQEIGRLSVLEISDLCENLSDAISKADLDRVGPAEDSPFNFTATPFVVGFDGPCMDWDCKIAQAKEFVRFAILYAEVVALPNEFEKYIGLGDLESEQLHLLKHDLIGKIFVLWELEDIIKSGIGAFIPNSVPLCEECGDELEKISKNTQEKIKKAAVNLQHKIVPSVNMTLKAFTNGIMYEVELPSDLFIEDFYLTAFPEEPPEWFKRTKNYKMSLKKGVPITLDVGEIERFGVIDYALLRMIPWTRYYLFSRIYMTSKYLTNRPIDGMLFDEFLPNKKIQKSSKNIKDYITLKMPLIIGTDTKDLLKVRQQDYDAFINYRVSISKIEKEFKNGRNFTEYDAQELYEDVVYPSLQRLESKAESLKRELQSSVAKKIIIATTMASMGIALGLIPDEVAKVLEVIGACEVINVAVDVWKSTDTPNTIRNEPFYFLWKVSKHHK